jgi:hypothetical protein
VIFNRTTIFFTCIFLLGTSAAIAQQKTDTTKPKGPLKIVSFDENNLHYGNKTAQDSIHYQLDSFQIVHPFLINTGNLGSPGHSLLPRFTRRDAFSVRPDAFAYFGFNRYNRRFYNSNQPYTLLQYFVGQKQEQYVNVIHARNFGDNLNFSFHFIRARSEGFYRRQNTSNSSLRTNLWYMSPTKRYSLMTDVFWTGANVAENGGLADDSTFTDANQLDRQVNEVNLNSAGTVQRKRGVWMKHTFALGKITDTLVLDTARSYNVITPAWGISLVSELFDEKYNYSDADPSSGLYNIIYRDSNETADSTYCWRINNSVRLEKFNQNGVKSINGFVGVRYEAGEYFNDTIYRHFNNIYAEGRMAYIFSQTFQPFCGKTRRVYRNQVDAGGWYVVSGFNSGNYELNLNGAISLGVLTHVAIHGTTAAFTPDVLFTNYSGNHLRWENAFETVHRSVSEIVLTNCGRNFLIEASAKFLSEENALYFNTDFLPTQYSGTINTSSFSILASWKAGWFNSATRFTYSHTSNTIIRMPEMLVQHTMYADVNLFKSALQLQVGTDVLWFSEFTAEAYMPAVAQFYIQNSRHAGDYAYISPWLSFRVKPVRVFVKVEHANAGLMGRKYFLLDHYPANDLALKIGLSWLFND